MKIVLIKCDYCGCEIKDKHPKRIVVETYQEVNDGWGQTRHRYKPCYRGEICDDCYNTKICPQGAMQNDN